MDGATYVVDGIQEVGMAMDSYVGSIGSGIQAFGMNPGDFAANAMVVVGSSVVKVAEQSYGALPPHVHAAAAHLGDQALATTAWVEEAAAAAAQMAQQVAGEALRQAKKSVAQGVKLCNQIGSAVASKAVQFGEVVETLGVMAAGVAVATWEKIKDMAPKRKM